jgi:2-dehydropantoate 2-reductase
MKFTIIGAGALGSLVGGALAEQCQPTFLIGRENHINTVNKKGLSISGVRGDKLVKLPGATSVDNISHKTDVFIITVKLADTPDVLSQLQDQIDEDTILLSFQNGIPIDTICQHSPKGIVMAAVTGWAATMAGPGRINHTSDGTFTLGCHPDRLNNQALEQIRRLEAIMQKIAPTSSTDNIYGHLWIKLLIASLYSVAAVAGYSFGDVIGDRRMKRILFRLWQEGYEVAAGLGVKPEAYMGQLLPEMLVVKSIPDYVRASFVIDFMLKDRKNHRPSVLQDLEQGKKTEIPYINGYIVEKASALKIPTPVNNAVMSMIEEIERGERKISRANIQKLFKSIIFQNRSGN